jgi:hypothetical protein
MQSVGAGVNMGDDAAYTAFAAAHVPTERARGCARATQRLPSRSFFIAERRHRFEVVLRKSHSVQMLSARCSPRQTQRQ